MSDTTKDIVQDNPNPEVKAETPIVQEQPKEPTVADLTPSDTKVTDKSVPLSVYLDTKTENKDLRKAVKDLEDKIAQGAQKVEISDDITALADKYKVDGNFLAELTAAAAEKARKVAAAEREAELQPLREAESKKKFDEAFDEHFSVAMGNVPEFAEVVNKSIIKTLAKDPSNASKTISQLIEEAYGNAVTGKRTVENTTPAGGKEPETIDYARASKDNTYLSTILSNPRLKAEYNKDLHRRIRF
jgi:hypothetical protein